MEMIYQITINTTLSFNTLLTLHVGFTLEFTETGYPILRLHRAVGTSYELFCLTLHHSIPKAPTKLAIARKNVVKDSSYTRKSSAILEAGIYFRRSDSPNCSSSDASRSGSSVPNELCSRCVKLVCAAEIKMAGPKFCANMITAMPIGESLGERIVCAATCGPWKPMPPPIPKSPC